MGQEQEAAKTSPIDDPKDLYADQLGGMNMGIGGRLVATTRYRTANRRKLRALDEAPVAEKVKITPETIIEAGQTAVALTDGTPKGERPQAQVAVEAPEGTL